MEVVNASLKIKAVKKHIKVLTLKDLCNNVKIYLKFIRLK